jgi:hypothetical protein
MMSTRLLKTALSPLPADNCPYASGRAGGFEQCPAFRPVVDVPSRPLMPGTDVFTHEPSPLVTCAYLTVGVVDSGRFYPRCQLGAPDARRRHARAQRGALWRSPGPAHGRQRRRGASALGGRWR